MKRSHFPLAALGVVVVAVLGWIQFHGPDGEGEASLRVEVRGQRAEPSSPAAALALPGTSSAGELETPRVAVQPEVSARRALDPGATTRMTGLLVDHLGQPVREKRFLARTAQGTQTVRTNEHGFFQVELPGELTPKLSSKQAGPGALHLWSSSPLLDRRVSRLRQVGPRAYRSYLALAPPDYVWSLRFRLPDGRPHANAGVVLFYRNGSDDARSWRRRSRVTDAAGCVTFELHEPLGIEDWIVTTSGTVKPAGHPKAVGGRPASITVGGRHFSTSAAPRYRPGLDPLQITYRMGYSRPVRLHVSSLPLDDARQLELEVLEVGKPVLTSSKFGAAGHALVLAQLLPGTYRARLRLRDREWIRDFVVENAEPRLEVALTQSAGLKLRHRGQQMRVVDPQHIELDFRDDQRSGR